MAYRMTRHQVEECERQIGGVLTIRDVMDIYDKAYKTVINAINSKRLIAEKRGGEYGEARGFWIISSLSAQYLWGKDNDISKR